MIPSNITREHIIEAINEIKRNGIPFQRESVRWSLIYEGTQFPPKYVISLASKFVSGRELDPSQFSGGDETNGFLEERGFEIVEKIMHVQVVKIVTHHANPERAAELFHEEGVVAVGFGGIGDISGLTKEEIKEKRHDEVGRNEQEALSDASQLITFRDKIHTGDIVIAYQTNNTVAMVGEIEGDYFFDDKNKVGNKDGDVGYANQRRVRWWEKPRNFNRSHLPPPLNTKVAVPGTILICERDYERSKLIEDLRNAGLEVRFQAVKRSWWIEKTYYKGRSGRETGESSLGKALWSPQKDRRGADIYKNMRAVKKGDIILHLIDNEAIVGISIVEKECDSNFFCLPGTTWDDGTGKRPGYMVTLESYEPLKIPLHRNDFLQQKHRRTLVGLIDQGLDVFYNRNLNLKQGAYLTRAPDELLGILSKVYKEKTGEELRYLSETRSDHITETLAPPITLNDYFLSQRFLFQEPAVSAFYAALKTKGFVILAGLTGTGKTKLPQLFFELVTKKDDQKLFFSVRPDWRDNKPLVGYFNPIERVYESTQLLDQIKQARNNWTSQQPKFPFFVLLDEMNLARVEYYFADFLSVLESGRDANSGLTKEPLRLHALKESCKTREGKEIESLIKLSPNLYFAGTVNLDETTYSFSPKVLDRSFVVEFWEVDLENYPPISRANTFDESERQLEERIQEDLSRNGRFLAYTKEDVESAIKALGTHFENLKLLNKILGDYGLHFGYRVIDEIALFYHNATESMNKGIIRFESEEQIVDYAVLMKVLPKIHGNRSKIDIPLRRLLVWAIDPENWNEIVKEFEDESGRFKKEHLEKLQTGSMEFFSTVCGARQPKYRKTAEKVARMIYQLYTTGFASFL